MCFGFVSHLENQVQTQLAPETDSIIDCPDSPSTQGTETHDVNKVIVKQRAGYSPALLVASMINLQNPTLLDDFAGLQLFRKPISLIDLLDTFQQA